MAVTHVEHVAVLGFVATGSFESDREARLLGLLPAPLPVPAVLVSTNYHGDHALLDPTEPAWRFEARP